MVDIEALNKTKQFSDGSIIHLTWPESTNLKLNCRLKTHGRKYKVNWNKNQNSLVTFDKITIDKFGYEVFHFDSKIELKNSTRQDSGFYTCGINITLENSIGKRKIIDKNYTYFLDIQCKLYFQRYSMDKYH